MEPSEPPLRHLTGDQAFRASIAAAARRHDRAGLRIQSLIYADFLEDSNRPDAAARRRLRGETIRRAGVLWPRVCSLPPGLSQHQAETLRRVLTAPVAILAGTPGTGKTHTTGLLVREIAARYGREAIAVCAPTGKAAVRVTDAMRRAGVALTASTIHSLLEIGRNGHDGDGWGFIRNAGNPLEEQFVIVDEASMLDTDLASSLFQACAPGTHVLLVGDPYQLPPVGHGAPLRDLIASGAVPHGELSEIRRNAGAIVEACAAIKNDKSFATFTPDEWEDNPQRNLIHIEAETDERISDIAFTCMSRDLAFPPYFAGNWMWDRQVLVPTNRLRKRLNKELQTKLNPDGTQARPNPFRCGDKIICLRNHMALGERDEAAVRAVKDGARLSPRGEVYIANGEIGHVVGVEPRRTWAVFPGDRLAMIPMGKPRADADDEDAEDGGGTGCDFDLAYAITGHKSQGSEWQVVAVIIDGSYGAKQICTKEWVYTAISRASQLCITVGRHGVLEQMAKRASLVKRKTFLREYLNGSIPLPGRG